MSFCAKHTSLAQQDTRLLSNELNSHLKWPGASRNTSRGLLGRAVYLSLECFGCWFCFLSRVCCLLWASHVYRNWSVTALPDWIQHRSVLLRSPANVSLLVPPPQLDAVFELPRIAVSGHSWWAVSLFSANCLPLCSPYRACFKLCSLCATCNNILACLC